MLYNKNIDYSDILKGFLSKIYHLDKEKIKEGKQRWNSIAKPLNGMGVLEEYISRIYAINNAVIDKKAVVVFCADNGIVEENISQSGNEVTAIVAKNMINSCSSVCYMARVAKSDIVVYDVGMAVDVEGTINRKTRYSTANFAKEHAMTKNEAVYAILVGIEAVRLLKEEGYGIVATGEMGIGNTTTTSAIVTAIFELDASLVAGKGAGLSKEGIARKAEVINKAMKLHKPNKSDPIDILSKVGGFDIAAICGVFLGGMIYSMPIIIDGFISSTAALLATMFDCNVRDYFFASHISGEKGAKFVADKLDITPPLNLSMALGEGTGAVALMPLLDMANSVYRNMATFDDVNIESYKPFG